MASRSVVGGMSEFEHDLLRAHITERRRRTLCQEILAEIEVFKKAHPDLFSAEGRQAVEQ